MKFSLMVSAGVAVTLSAGLAFANIQFGGDDTGWVPPDKATAKCEDGVSKNVGTLAAALIKCNIKDSDDHFKHGVGTGFDGQACQNTAKAKWDTKVGALVCTGPAACVDDDGIRDLTVTLINLNGGVVFCDNTTGTPQDSPGTGFVPPTKTVQKCEDGVAKNAGKLTGAIGKCHIKAADSAIKSKSFDEEGCEVSAIGKYVTAAGKLTGCPTCLGPSGQAALGALVESLLDTNNIDAYCASPSGAFLN